MHDSITNHKQLYINGLWQDSSNAETLEVINPATAEPIAQVTQATTLEVDEAVKAARLAFTSWSQTSAEERADYIAAITQGLRQRSEEMAMTISQEMGAPLDFSRTVQVADPVEALAKHSQRTHLLHEEEHIDNAKVIKEPIGVCAFITPWNYPLHQLIGKVAPALAAGCTMVLKPSELTPLHALLFAEIVHEAGLPAGVFNLVNGNGQAVGEPLCTHPEVDMISFTGSTGAGVRISQLAAPGIKRVCLELGGKSPFIISETEDLQTAVTLGVDDVMYNSGQTCTALTRMLVPRNRYQEAVKLAKTHMEKIKPGCPMAADTFMGPMASAAHRDRVKSFIAQGIAEGAQLVTGGLEPPEGVTEGFYIRPTLFADVHNQMSIAQEEIFGPVLCMLAYESDDEAISIANDSAYGLSARVWCDDTVRAEALARRIRAGQVYINAGQWNHSAPFGGYKQSGNGREMGDLGVEEFFEIKALLN